MGCPVPTDTTLAPKDWGNLRRRSGKIIRATDLGHLLLDSIFSDKGENAHTISTILLTEQDLNNHNTR